MERTASTATASQGLQRRPWEALRRNFSFGVLPGLPVLFLLVVLLAALFAPQLAPYNPTRNRIYDSLIPPFWLEGGGTAHLLGTDYFGRDVLSRLIYGARISLIVSGSVILLGGSVGTVLGLVAGYFDGRWFSVLIMRLVDVFLAFPIILLAMAVAAMIGPSTSHLILIISLFTWDRYARQIRGETLGIRVSDYVTYAVIAGTPSWKIIFRHIFPNVVPTLLVLATLQIGTLILLEASLSFLGVGVPPPAPTWGGMVSDGRGFLATGWWISLFPGLAIMAMVMCANLLGDWLRDKLDPRLRQV